MKPPVGLVVTAEECAGSFDRMLRRFIRKVKEEGIIQEYREKQRADKPSVARRRKHLRALRREKSLIRAKKIERLS